MWSSMLGDRGIYNEEIVPIYFSLWAAGLGQGWVSDSLKPVYDKMRHKLL